MAKTYNLWLEKYKQYYFNTYSQLSKCGRKFFVQIKVKKLEANVIQAQV